MGRPTTCAAAVAVTLLLLLGGCSGSEGTQSPPSESSSTTPAPDPTPSATPPPRAEPVPLPADDACYDLSYDEAVAPTPDAGAVACRRRHTAETYFVGRVANEVDGHLLAVDSARVQGRVARSCPAKLGAAVGGSPDDLRLSMLRAVWFTPTVEQSDAGADWYRCDMVALDAPDDLSTVTGSLRGILDTPAGRAAYAMCGTAGPDDPDFTRVRCSATHSWRAFSVIELDPGAYPGAAAIRAAGSDPCHDAAGEIAADPLDYDWGYEGPDRTAWEAGQTYIRCWAPD